MDKEELKYIFTDVNQNAFNSLRRAESYRQELTEANEVFYEEYGTNLAENIRVATCPDSDEPKTDPVELSFDCPFREGTYFIKFSSSPERSGGDRLFLMHGGGEPGQGDPIYQDLFTLDNIDFQENMKKILSHCLSTDPFRELAVRSAYKVADDGAVVPRKSGGPSSTPAPL